MAWVVSTAVPGSFLDVPLEPDEGQFRHRGRFDCGQQGPVAALRRPVQMGCEVDRSVSHRPTWTILDYLANFRRPSWSKCRGLTPYYQTIAQLVAWCSRRRPYRPYAGQMNMELSRDQKRRRLNCDGMRIPVGHERPSDDEGREGGSLHGALSGIMLTAILRALRFEVHILAAPT